VIELIHKNVDAGKRSVAKKQCWWCSWRNGFGSTSTETCNTPLSQQLISYINEQVNQSSTTNGNVTLLFKIS